MHIKIRFSSTTITVLLLIAITTANVMDDESRVLARHNNTDFVRLYQRCARAHGTNKKIVRVQTQQQQQQQLLKT